MTVTLTLPPSLEERFVTTAEALHMSIEDYLLLRLGASVPKVIPAPLAGESDEDFTKALLSLSQTATPSNLSYTTWTRAEIYQDHD